MLRSVSQQLYGVICSIYVPCLIVSLCLIGTTACRYIVSEDIQPTTPALLSYSMGKAVKDEASDQWWQAFDDSLLNGHIQQALSGSFTIQQGVARLKQARLASNQIRSGQYPQLTGGLGYNTNWRQNGEHNESNAVAIELAWEVDLWGELSSASASASFEALAVADELQSLASRLSVEVAETYYQFIEQTLLLALLREQIEANETSLNLIKLRFANGAASLVDVYQQEELVASVKAQLPLSEARILVLRNTFHILLGQLPDNSPFPNSGSLPDIPAFPDLGVPADLLLKRPDLRQLQRELIAADYRIAEAVADRLPSIKIGSSAGFFNGDLLFTIFGDALATIIDWGVKKNEVEKRKAVVEEKMASYSQRYLLAIEEVESSLWQERKHAELLTALREQLRISRAVLNESRNRYIQGITDYLPVLAALVSRQKLERSILQRQREHLSYRLLLYRALGNTLLNIESHPQGVKIE